MRELRAKMDQSVQDTIIATRIIDANRNPGQPQGSVYLKNYANFPLEYVLSFLLIHTSRLRCPKGDHDGCLSVIISEPCAHVFLIFFLSIIPALPHLCYTWYDSHHGTMQVFRANIRSTPRTANLD